MTVIHAIEEIEPAAHKAFVAGRLLALKERLRRDISAASDERSLRLATWNLMHFGSGGGYDRTPESMLYIAEIIDHFDLVAVQEVNEKLEKFDLLFAKHLGPGWDYIVTDTTEGARGNSERLAFAYRKSKVSFRKEAGEIVLPRGQEIAEPGGAAAGGRVQFARTPFSVAFQSGWFRFKLCTVHIYYGDSSESSPEMRQRRQEIERIAQFLADRQRRQQETVGSAANFILLGDFNVVSPSHHTMQALESSGFAVPQAIKDAPTSLSGNHHYDQIAFKLADDRFEFLGSGVFDMFDVVYRDADADQYVDVVRPPIFDKNSKGKARTRQQKIGYFRRYFRRHQMSDHKLLWCEIKTDFSDDYLAAVQGGG